MSETYINGYPVTMAASIDNSSTSLSVSSAASVDGGFRIKIDTELLQVSSGGTGTTWTVVRGVEGTVAASHASGASVYVILTAQGLSNILSQPAESHTATNGVTSTLDFTNWYDSNYSVYDIVFENIIPSTTSVLNLLCSTDGGSTYDTSTNYAVSRLVWSYLGIAEGGGINLTAFQFFPYDGRTMVTGNNFTLSGTIRLYNPGGSYYANMIGSMLGNDSANSAAAQRLDVQCWYTVATPVNAFSISVNTGTFGGTVNVYKR